MYEENWDDPTPPSQPIAQHHEDNFRNYNRAEEKSRNTRPRKHEGSGWRSNSRFNNRNEESNNFYRKRQDDRNFDEKLYMKVDSRKVGSIIGKQGSKIRELEQGTGTRIKIGDYCEDDNWMKEVIISGKNESVIECKKLIEELVLDKPRFTMPVNDEVPVIDWDAINRIADKAESEKWAKCCPIKKNFYIEDPEISKMSEKEADMFRKEKNNIVVENVFGTTEKCLKPVKTFAHAFKHYPEIMREIKKQGFTIPSPIQCQAWPILLSGKDLIGIAQTGTGKTLAFILPALIHIDGQSTPRSERGGANVLIIAPTRELALQIEKEVEKYSYKDIRSVCVYGGGNRRQQSMTVTSGVEIIIATPGRLNDLVEANIINLNSITYIVLDEADRMLDMGFEPQIRKILLDIRPDRQSVMTSATWPSKVQTLAERYMSTSKCVFQVYIGSLDLAAVHSVSQTVLVVREDEKRDYLLDFIKSLTEDDKVIVFVSKKIAADRLSCDLSLDHILCQCIHGDRDQSDREQALEDLKTGAVKILIATDVASRGLDITDITKVFNYDFPRNIEEYVHRVGRTGRAGKKGEAVTLFTRGDFSFAGELITIMEEAEQPVPASLYKMRDKFLACKEERGSSSFGNRGRRRFENDNNFCF